MSEHGVVRVLGISGSLRTASSNTALVHAAIRLAPAGVDVSVFGHLADIPPFNPDLDGADPPSVVRGFRAALQDCDAVLISSPEYAHGVPGVLKNALDWIVGSGELIDKPIALINTSTRATYAYASLKETLTTMSAQVIEAASVTIPLDGRVRDADALTSDQGFSALMTSALEVLSHAVRSPDTNARDGTTPADLQFLEDQVNEHNIAHTGVRDARDLVMLLRDADGRIYAGLRGHTWGGAAEVRFLWVDESRRRTGIGSRLLRAAEQEASARGCKKMVLSTHSFQAPDFYLKHGYTVAGEILDYPQGHRQIYLEKSLEQAPMKRGRQEFV